jgi:hypothetical protein
LTLHKVLIRLMLVPPGNSRQIPIKWNCSVYKTRFSAPLAIFQGTHQFPIYTRLSKFRTYMII